MSSKSFQSYAIAIFDIAKTKQVQEKYYQQILDLDALNNTYPDFAKVLSTVTLAKEERRQLAKDVLSLLEFDDTIIYWVFAIIDNNDYFHYHLIARECRKLHHLLFNVTRVDITTPTSLSESQMQKLSDFFGKKLGTKIDLKVTLDPELIGGLQIQVNNKTYNNTYKKKLESMKNELLSKKG